MAGRLELIRSVLASITLHVCSVLPVPITILRRIESLMANFLWDAGATSRYHWVSWDRICKPVAAGGLGILKLRDMMLSLHGKLAWSYIRHTTIWAQYAHSRFQLGRRGSGIWNTFNHLVVHLRESVGWIFGKGDLRIALLGASLGIQPPEELCSLTVREVCMDYEKKLRMEACLPRAHQHLLSSVTFGDGDDYMVWKGSSDGVFSSKAFRDSFRTLHPTPPWAARVWNSWLPPKLSCIVWRLALNALPLDNNILRMGFSLASQCPTCKVEREDCNHTFFTCNTISPIWSWLSWCFGRNRPLTVNSLLVGYLGYGKRKSLSDAFRVGLACAAVWEIWVARNRAVYGKPSRDIVHTMRGWVIKLASVIPYRVASKDDEELLKLLGVGSRPRIEDVMLWRRWRPGSSGVTLNLGITSNTLDLKGAAIFRDPKGDMILAYVQAITKCSEAEELVLFCRAVLELARAQNIPVSSIQSSHPSTYLLHATHARNVPWSLVYALRDIRQLSNSAHNTRICTMHNGAALCLAYTGDYGLFRSVQDLPLPVQRCFLVDKSLASLVCRHGCEHMDDQFTMPTTHVDDSRINTFN